MRTEATQAYACGKGGKLMERTAVVQSAWEAYAAGDLEGALKYFSPGLVDRTVATQPSGERTDSPIPLSSHTNSTGIRSPE